MDILETYFQILSTSSDCFSFRERRSKKIADERNIPKEDDKENDFTPCTRHENVLCAGGNRFTP